MIAGDCYFGRIEGNEIVVPDVRTSRRHAVVQRQGNHFVVVDLGSTNGTSLNDRRIFKPSLLRDRDVIGVGGLRYVFRHPAGATDPDTHPPMATSAAVGITSCWVMLASVPEAAGTGAHAWIEAQGGKARECGGKARQIRKGTLLIHWRTEQTPAAAVRAHVLGIPGPTRPQGAHVAVHHGAVRVGPGSGLLEETLLGAAVSLVYNLEATARKLGVPVLLSEPAMRTLGLVSAAERLGARKVEGVSGAQELFSLGKP